MQYPEVIGLVIKLISTIGLWYVGGQMLYQNEMERPKHDRVADQATVAFITALWPVWIIGLVIAGVVYIFYQFFGGIVRGVFWAIHFFQNE